MYLLAEFPHGIIIRIYDDAKCSGIKSTKRSREEGRLPQNCAGFKWSTFISIAGNSRAPQSVKISIFQIYGTYFNVSAEQCAKLRGLHSQTACGYCLDAAGVQMYSSKLSGCFFFCLSLQSSTRNITSAVRSLALTLLCVIKTLNGL